MFQCQLCECYIPDVEFITHPETCPGINPTGMFWGMDTTATSSATSSESSRFVEQQSTTPLSSSEGIATEDEEDDDDEPFLNVSGMGEDDFSRFAKTWRSRHTIIEENEEGGSAIDGIFTETGAFHVPPYEEYASSSEGIASTDDDEEEFTEGEEEEEFFEGEVSELERVLQEGLRDVTAEIEQLVFA